MMWNVSIDGDFDMTDMLYTCSIVGLERGLSFKQANAIFAIKITSLATEFSGNGSLWSKTSFNSKLYALGASEDEKNVEMRSPGCFPIIISKQSTPKLNTSHFSFTLRVNASSVKK